MNLYKLERKFGKYTVPHLSRIIIAFYIFGYILQLAAPSAMELLQLNPYRVLHGQVWRLISWLLVPPSGFGIFTLINLFFFYSIGTTLERIWGDFRYNVYIFMGIIFMILGVFLIYFVGISTGLMGAKELGDAYFSYFISVFVSTYYINISVILAFAMTIPDMQILFWFIIPLKMKYLAYLEGIMLLVDFMSYSRENAMFPSVPRAVMIISLLNYFVFYFSSRKLGNKNNSFNSAFKRRSFKVYEYKEKAQAGNLTRHKCAICGQTEKDNPSLSFRFCSKCNGNYEYCENHLYTHTHIE